MLALGSVPTMSTIGDKELRVHLLGNVAGKIHKMSLLSEPGLYSFLYTWWYQFDNLLFVGEILKRKVRVTE